MIKILFVGAGAVGSVYGNFAHKGGASVHYLVKPKHVSDRKNGIHLYRHTVLNNKPEFQLFQSFLLHDSVGALPSGEKFSYVIVTLPSHALRSGNWLEELAAHPSVSSARWVILSPGVEDANYVIDRLRISPSLVADGSIPLMSYWAPLPGEKIEPPGYAFWIPPRGRFEISPVESGEDWNELIELFSRGGLTTRIHSYREGLLLADPALRCVVAGLEKSEWSFQKFIHGPNLLLASEAAKECATIHAARLGSPDPMKSVLKRMALSPWALRSALRFLAKISPFDLEAFFHAHFTKVEDQMHAGMREILDQAKKFKLPANYVRQMIGRN